MFRRCKKNEKQKKQTLKAKEQRRWRGYKNSIEKGIKEREQRKDA